MVLSLMPAVSVAAGSDTDEIEYVFNRAVAGSTADVSFNDDATDGAGDAGYAKTGSAQWDFLSRRAMHDRKLISDSLRYRTQYQNAATNALAFRISVPESGTYDLTANFVNYASGGVAKIFVFNEATRAENNWNLIGESTNNSTLTVVRNTLTPTINFDTYSAVETKASASAEGIELNAGDNYVVVAVDVDGKFTDAMNAAGTDIISTTLYYVRLQSLVLSKQTPPAPPAGDPKSYTYNISNTALGVANVDGKNYADLKSNAGIEAKLFGDTWKASYVNQYQRRLLADGYSANTKTDGIKTNNGSVIALTVPAAGTYVPTVTFDKSSGGGKVGVRFISETQRSEKGWTLTNNTGMLEAIGALPLSDSELIDLYDAKAKTYTFDVAHKVTFEPVTFDEGINYVIFNVEGYNSALGDAPAPLMEIAKIELDEYVKSEEEERTEFEYITTWDEFNTADMWWSYSNKQTVSGTNIADSEYGAWTKFPGVRTAGYNGKGAIPNTALMALDATVSIGKNGETLSTPLKVRKQTSTSDKWELAMSRNPGIFNVAEEANAIAHNFEGTRFGHASRGSYLMLRLTVPKAGKYTLSYNGNRDAEFASPAVYFVKDDGAAIADYSGGYKYFVNEAPIGYANFSDTEKQGYVKVGTADVSEAGDYLVVFYADSKETLKSTSTTTNPLIELSGIKLTPFEEGDDADIPQSLEISVALAELAEGETTQISAVAVYSRTGKEEVKSGITYESSDENVATVAADGTVTAVGDGLATITATLDGTNISDTVKLDVIGNDPGNRGVIVEYKTTWDALSGDKLPTTTDSNLYNNGTYSRKTSSGNIIMNRAIMNRRAESTLDKDGNTVEAWKLQDSSVTAPWDWAFGKSTSGARINQLESAMWQSFKTTTFKGSEPHMLALRINVPNKGKYNLALDTMYRNDGLAAAVYFLRDDGSIKSEAALYSAINELSPIAYHETADPKASGYRLVGEVDVPRKGDYYVVFVGDAESLSRNSAATSDHQYFYLKGIRLSVVPGAPESVELAIDGIENEGDPMPLMTEKQITFVMSDEDGIELEVIDPQKLTVAYSSDNEEVATVSESGLVSAVGNGSAKLTCDITYDGKNITKEYNLLVAPSGKNLMAHLNPDFEGDKWVWSYAYEPEKGDTAKFIRAAIETAPKADDADNRAFVWILDGEVPAVSNPSALTLKTDGSRVKINPKNFYQLVFKVKADYINPENAADMNLFLDVYTFADATSSTSGFDSGRSMNLTSTANWRELTNDWYEIALPLPAPAVTELSTVYITPRFAIRPVTADLPKAGYKGKVWFDDFELREVGYAGVEVETLGDTTSGTLGDFTLRAKPYTTLGHYISLWDEMSTNAIKITSSDEYVIGNIKPAEILQAVSGSGMFVADSQAKNGGKNGKTEIRATIELNGVTRSGMSTVETSGFEMKLLYAALAAEDMTVAAGGTTKVTPTGYMTDGSVADLTGAIISYKSMTPDVVSVDAEGNVSALRAGEGIVKVNMLLNDAGAEAEIAITVTDDSAIKEATLTALGTVGYLRDEELVLSGVTEAEFAANIDAAEVEWVVANPEAVEIRNGNLVFGKKLGEKTEVYAKVTLGGATVTTNSVEIEVTKTDLRDHLIDFRKASQSRAIDVTIEEDGWEINKANTSNNAKASTFSTMGLLGATKAVTEMLTLDFELPYEGAYQVILTSYYYTYNALLGDIYIDGVYIGDYVYHNNTNAPAEPERLRSVYLTAGKHTITFDPTVAGPRRSWQIIRELRFRAVEDIAGISKIIAPEDVVLRVGATESLGAKVKMADGFEYGFQKMLDGKNDAIVSVAYASSDATVAEISAEGVITAKAAGEATITVTVTDGETELSETVRVEVNEEGAITSGGLSEIEITSVSFVMSPDSEGITLSVEGKDEDGNVADVSELPVVWTSEDTSVVEISESGFATPVSVGSARITATVTTEEGELSAECFVSVREGKVARTYYSDEMLSAARENISKYSWAKSESNAVVRAAEKFVGKEEEIWNLIPGEGLPRGYGIGYRDDPNRATCRYCGADLKETHNTEIMETDPLARPWKVRCQVCRRVFPSNDFAKFYELGRGEDGVFNSELAFARHEELFGGTYGTGYLKNDLYPEIGGEKHPSTIRLTAGETPELWGVDAGFGYDTGRVLSNGTKEVHTYVANYHYSFWYQGFFFNAIANIRDAYIYTGDMKYGRLGAILLDRVADVYPDFDLRPYLPEFANGDGSSGMGKQVGKIHETYLEASYAKAYDAFFPLYDDQQVISFLSKKKEQWPGIRGDKSTPEGIRRNLEDGILRASRDAIMSYLSHGNFGMHQSSMALAAVVLDTYPETDIMLDWITKYSVTTKEPACNTGGGVNQRLIEDVSRDGQGNESAPGYNRIWITELSDLADTIAKYPKYTGTELNLYEHAKYIGMIKSYAPFTLVRRGVPSIGDSGQTGGFSPQPDEEFVLINSFKYTKDPQIAQHLYFQKKGELSDIHYDIFTKNPESLAADVQAVIDEHGEYNYDKSSMLTGYGWGALRDGTLYDSVGTDVIRDMTRSFWIYFGGSASHNHEDKLNLGIEAYGIGMTSDLGYPEATGSDQNRIQWQNATISHNTVVVNEQTQLKSQFTHKPLHFDAKDTRVKVMDIDAATTYTATDDYRRTIVMVNYDDEVSYGIDFFRVLGGEDHLYSFHANSDTDPRTSDNLKFEAQLGGTYAGAAVPFGPDPYSSSASSYNILKYPIGYTWLVDVKRADNPQTGEFWAEWDIKDFRNFQRNGKMDIKLRMTMLNDWDATEVSLANGYPPRKPNNLNYISHLEYILVRRSGRDLDTLFTTVYEPYNANRYIKSMESVPVTVVDGTPAREDAVKAIKVELIDGRCDYIIYAQNNKITYNVGGVFDFRGFVGVWTVNEHGSNIYSYINDGDYIGDITDKTAALTGRIVDFTRELSTENELIVEFDRAVTDADMEEITDRLIDVEREGLGNSAYIIVGAEKTGDNTARLDLGGITTISGFIDEQNEALGYTYDVAVGKTFKIPMSFEKNAAPVFDAVSEGISTSAGSSVSVRVNATSENGAVTYAARTLPRGASFDAETATVTWKPTSSQIGENLFAVDATDESGRLSTVYFTVKVYGSTGGAGGSGSSGTTTPGTTTPTIPATKPDDKDNVGDSSDNAGTGVPDGPQTPSTTERFVDLGNHAWAADAINSLADESIIKGTSENTFSPAANITRADFAILLVRAFELASESEENFADVQNSDYFAKELAIARNTGLVNGIGENKFAPRNNITRQDMMVIVYRALKSMDKLVGDGVLDVPQASDFANVSDYAKEAVSALVNAKLVNGKNGLIAPTDFTTRAEVAVLIKRILDFIK